MDLSTKYLGMDLRTPLVPSASPLSEKKEGIKRMEDAGASAIVLYSLFEEQIEAERHELHNHLTYYTNSFAEAVTFFPEPADFHLGPEEYLNHVRRAKEAVGIPVIASLNGITLGGWVDYAHQIEQAGADALELNIYYIPTDIDMTSAEVEQGYIDIVESVRSEVSIPVAVKIGPYFSNLTHMARRLVDAGADGLVLFNRFYQPDIDIEELDARSNLILSTPQTLRLPLRWIAILHKRVRASLAATGGIHTAQDAIKMLMAGADATMMASALLKNGINHITKVENDMIDWMEAHEYESVREMQGSMSHKNSADPAVYERTQYIRGLHNFRYAGAK